MVGFKSFAALSLAAVATAHPGHTLKARDLPVGSIISKCTKPGVVALTFDDGPFDYTNELLDLLEKNGHKGTFFVNGKNYGAIENYAPVLQRMKANNHQIGSHTWEHKDLALLSEADIRSQMTQVEDALIKIIGVYPYYMRPPFLSTNDLALKTLGSMGYHVINVDIDTLDWQYDDDDVTISEKLYQDQYNLGGTISLNHDPEPVTVKQLVPWILDFLSKAGKKSVTVGECLGDTGAGWYRTRGGVSSSSSRASSSSSRPATSSSRPAGSSSISSRSATSSSRPAGSSSASSHPTGSSSASSHPTGSSSVSSHPAGSSSVSSRPAGSSSLSSRPAGSGSVSSRPAGSGSSSSAPPAASGKTSPDDTCGGKNGYVCGSGKCCSQYGYCGKATAYCGAGCQPLFGSCSSSSGDGSTPPSGGSGPVSPNGNCGIRGGYSCPSGSCCSMWGYCGTGKEYCGIESTSGGPSPSGPVSQDGKCGGSKGSVCGGGQCCSPYGWCGSSSDYCDAGCQSAFGKCR